MADGMCLTAVESSMGGSGLSLDQPLGLPLAMGGVAGGHPRQ